MRKHAVNYWYGVEDEIAHHMGVGDGDEPLELPYGVEVPAALEESAREYYAEELRQSVPDPSGFMDNVKVAVMNAVAKQLGRWLRTKDLDYLADQLGTNLIWLGDSFAHEELFGFVGGDPEYNFFLDQEWKELVRDLQYILKEEGKNPELVNSDELERKLMEAAQNAGDGGLQQEIEDAYERAKQGLAEFVQGAYEEPLEEISALFETYLNEAVDPRAVTAEDLVLWLLSDDTYFSFDYDDFVTAMGGPDGAEAKLLALAKEAVLRPDPRQTELRLEASARRLARPRGANIRRAAAPSEFYVGIEDLCAFYAIDPDDAGVYGAWDVRVYRNQEGSWSVEPLNPHAELVDEHWAPRSDADADELYEQYGQR